MMRVAQKRGVEVKGNARSSGYERHAQDWYVKPARAVHALLDAEPFAGGIWDPACGGGNIPTVCASRGFSVMGTDIAHRGYGIGGIDFLQTRCDSRAQNIVTNPPFALAVDFALHGIIVAERKIAILQRTTWLEGEARHQRLFRHGWLARVWQFRSRISMPPGGSDIEAKGGSVAFAWFVFEAAHSGPAALGWLP